MRFPTCWVLFAMSGDSLPQKHFTMCPSMAVPFTETMAWAALSWEENLEEKKIQKFNIKITRTSDKGNKLQSCVALSGWAMCMCWPLEARRCYWLVPDEGVSLLWEDPYFHYLTKRWECLSHEVFWKRKRKMGGKVFCVWLVVNMPLCADSVRNGATLAW